jgi:pimeloyl-ACP methyl ester carboxylesterase
VSRLSVLMGAGAVAAGVSAALIAGADVASAETGPDSSKPGASAGSSDKSDAPGGPSRSADRAGAAADTVKSGKAGKANKVRTAGKPSRATTQQADDAAKPSTPTASPVSNVDESAPETEAIDVRPVSAVPRAQHATARSEDSVSPLPRVTGSAAEPVSLAAAVSTGATVTASAGVNDLLGALPEAIQSVVYDIIGVAVTFVAGPPVVPPGSKVTVHSSTLDIAEGHTVPADWYYPDGDTPPERIILLQHGFLGVSAMYSYTAANLAQSTNSIVVVPTLSSNRYVEGGFWLGDDQVYQATANLFLGDRDALTASALAAGFAAKYGTGVALPDQFVLVGHSLGGGVVSGAAGYYAEAVIASGAENHLAGVVLLDAAPPGDTLPDALDKLDGLGTFIPVLELGAPKDTISGVDVALNTHRPGIFNGVILTDGKHLDSMMGGTPLIQLISHLYQGFPTAQNQAAAQTLIAGWTNDIFAGRIDPSTGTCAGADCDGIYGELGQTLPLTTTAGPTSATVIGAPAPVSTPEFTPVSATALVAPAGRSFLIQV